MFWVRCARLRTGGRVCELRSQPPKGARAAWRTCKYEGGSPALAPFGGFEGFQTRAPPHHPRHCTHRSGRDAIRLYNHRIVIQLEKRHEIAEQKFRLSRRRIEEYFRIPIDDNADRRNFCREDVLVFKLKDYNKQSPMNLKFVGLCFFAP